jgi:hypothetical protein
MNRYVYSGGKDLIKPTIDFMVGDRVKPNMENKFVADIPSRGDLRGKIAAIINGKIFVRWDTDRPQQNLAEWEKYWLVYE